jgi:outer membrane protein assembly factor BamD
MRIKSFLSVFCLVLFMVSCSGKTPVKSTDTFDPEKSFVEANKLIENKDYSDARSLLLQIKNRDLSKKFAPLAQLRIADSYVKEEEADLAAAEYRRFIEIYPEHRYAPYAQYQIAMIYYNEIEDPERGRGSAARALAEFEKLKRDFPRNPYKDMVDIRIEKCRNIMADYEYMVGEFYMKKGSYDAAIGRLEGLLATYPDYKKSEKVLLNLGLSYKMAGNPEKAREYFHKLVEKYPNSPYASDAKKELSSLNAGKKK